MLNTKLILRILISLITISLIYASHDKEKPSYLWVLAIIMTCLTLGIIVYERVTEFRKAVNSRKTIAPLIRGLVEFNETWFDMMAVKGGKPQSKFEDLSKKELTTILKKINPQSSSPIVSVNEGNRRFNWTEFLLQLCLQTNIKINEIYSHIANIDSELVKRLGEVKNNYLQKEMQIQPSMIIENKDLVYELNQIYVYFQKINSIKSYYEKNLKQYDNAEPQNAWTPYLEK